MRRAFVVNSDKCIGCRGCAMACKSFNQLEPERSGAMSTRWIKKFIRMKSGRSIRWPVTTAKTRPVWRRVR